MHYRPVLDIEVMHFVLLWRPAERRFLLKTFEALAADPYRRGDLKQRAVDGRMMEVLVFGHYLITFWADHAVKELRVARVQTS